MGRFNQHVLRIQFNGLSSGSKICTFRKTAAKKDSGKRLFVSRRNVRLLSKAIGLLFQQIDGLTFIFRISKRITTKGTTTTTTTTAAEKGATTIALAYP